MVEPDAAATTRVARPAASAEPAETSRHPNLSGKPGQTYFCHKQDAQV